MLRFFTLLISALIVVSANAEEPGDSLNTNVSGYVSGTYISNKDWYPSTDRVALNLDMGYKNWAFSAQVANGHKDLIQRAILEYSIPVSERNELNLQVGEFTRILSFYPNLTDAPSTSGMAMYPLGLYNRAFLSNKTFTTLEGINVVDKINLRSGILSVRLDYGSTGEIDSQCQVQGQLIGIHCNPGIKLGGSKDNYDYGLIYESPFLSLLLYHNQFRDTNTLLKPNDPLSVSEFNHFSMDAFTSDSAGFQYSFGKGMYVQVEGTLTHLDTAFYKQPMHYTGTTTKEYITAGDCFSEKFCDYVSFSKEDSRKAIKAFDRVIGITYLEGTWVTSVEFHHGVGSVWEEAFAPNPNWNSWVVSSTFRF